ncbi:MAG: glycosyltransferase family 2 protein [Patescibacteria group bacterium]
MTDLSIVVVTYKENLDVLKACFDSVQASQGLNYELLIIDNGANDATRGLLESYPLARYIRNMENKGFSAAVNQGMKLSTGKYILLLNPDTLFEPETLFRMILRLNKDENVGISSCLIRYPDGGIQESIRRFPRLLDQLQMLFKVPHVRQTKAFNNYMMREADPSQVLDVDSIMGAFMFIRRDVIDEIGLFDERYFIWFEEVDYCKMAHDAGWKVRHYGDLEIMHHKGHMFSKIATLRKQRWIRTSLRKYMRKHHGILPWMFLWAVTPIVIMLAVLVSFVKPK